MGDRGSSEARVPFKKGYESSSPAAFKRGVFLGDRCQIGLDLNGKRFRGSFNASACAIQAIDTAVDSLE